MKNDFENLQLLWLRLKDGDEQAFFILYKALYNPLFNYGFITYRERENVEDAINQMFLEIWERKAQLKVVTNVKSYLFTYLRRKIGSSKSEEAKLVLPSVDLYEQSIVDYIDQLQLEEDTRTNIFNAIGKLTARQKQLIMLRFYENLEYDQISEQTGLATRTVYNNIHQAIKFLRTELKIPTYILILLLKK